MRENGVFGSEAVLDGKNSVDLGGGMLRMWNGSFGCGVVECGPQNDQAKQN